VNRLVNIFPDDSAEKAMFEQLLAQFPEISEMPSESPMAKLMEGMSDEMKRMSQRHWDKLRVEYILDKDNNAIPCNKRVFLCWIYVVGEDRRIVKHTQVGKILVSTVFLTKDQSMSWREDAKPLLFETYVFDGLEEGVKDRYGTWQEAEEGHNRWVKAVTECN
jgi:hypothetical protein